MADGGVKLLALLLEIFIVIRCLEIAFRKKVSVNGQLLVPAAAVMAVYAGINFGMLSPFWAFTAYGIILLYSFFVFRLSWLQTMVRVVVALILTGCLEALPSIGIQMLTGEYGKSEHLLAAAMTASFVAEYLRNLKLGKAKDRKWFREKPKKQMGKSLESENKTGNGTKRKKRMEKITAVLIISSFCSVLMDYYIYKRPIRIYVLLTLVLALFLRVYLQRSETAEKELDRKKDELELERKYGENYEEIIKEIRWKQHDYRNQLGAIYSTHIVAQSLEQLIGMQSEYVNCLQRQQKYDGILTSCNHRLLAGYLYHSCCSCEEKGVTVDYSLRLDQVSCCLEIQQVIEILGILINNACEYVLQEEQVARKIFIRGEEEAEKIVFMVSNEICSISRDEIRQMLEYGMSSKGEGRGLGLARIIQLTKEKRIRLKVHQRYEEEKNWLDMVVEINVEEFP